MDIFHTSANLYQKCPLALRVVIDLVLFLLAIASLSCTAYSIAWAKRYLRVIDEREILTTAIDGLLVMLDLFLLVVDSALYLKQKRAFWRRGAEGWREYIKRVKKEEEEENSGRRDGDEVDEEA